MEEGVADRSTNRRDDVTYVPRVGVRAPVCLSRSLLSSSLPRNIRCFYRSDQPIPDRSDQKHVTTTTTDQMLRVNCDGCKGGREDDVNA